MKAELFRLSRFSRLPTDRPGSSRTKPGTSFRTLTALAHECQRALVPTSGTRVSGAARRSIRQHVAPKPGAAARSSRKHRKKKNVEPRWGGGAGGGEPPSASTPGWLQQEPAWPHGGGEGGASEGVGGASGGEEGPQREKEGPQVEGRVLRWREGPQRNGRSRRWSLTGLLETVGCPSCPERPTVPSMCECGAAGVRKRPSGGQIGS